MRIQLSRKKGFRLQEASRAINGLACVKVDRATRYGNPHKISTHVDAARSVKMFRADWGAALKSANTHPRHPPMPYGEPIFLGPLRGKNLACWCKPGAPCHADVLLELANS